MSDDYPVRRSPSRVREMLVGQDVSTSDEIRALDSPRPPERSDLIRCQRWCAVAVEDDGGRPRLAQAESHALLGGERHAEKDPWAAEGHIGGIEHALYVERRLPRPWALPHARHRNGDEVERSRDLLVADHNALDDAAGLAPKCGEIVANALIGYRRRTSDAREEDDQREQRHHRK